MEIVIREIIIVMLRVNWRSRKGTVHSPLLCCYMAAAELSKRGMQRWPKFIYRNEGS